MLKTRLPSPALVVACIALAVALGGAGYAAVTLPANSVGSKQVKPNSLKGADILESSLLGLQKGQVVTNSRVLLPSSGFVTLITVSGVGRIEVDCAPGAASTNERFFNTTSAAALTWVGAGGDNATYQTVGPGSAGSPFSTSGADISDLATWYIRTAGSNPKVTVIHVATVLEDMVASRHFARAEVANG